MILKIKFKKIQRNFSEIFQDYDFLFQDHAYSTHNWELKSSCHSGQSCCKIMSSNHYVQNQEYNYEEHYDHYYDSCRAQ